MNGVNFNVFEKKTRFFKSSKWLPEAWISAQEAFTYHLKPGFVKTSVWLDITGDDYNTSKVGAYNTHHSLI